MRFFFCCVLLCRMLAVVGDRREVRDRGATVQLIRVRRQERLLCVGNTLPSELLKKILETNRQSLRDSEPIKVGDAANIGIFDLRNGRAYGVANVFFQGNVNVDCKVDPQYVSLELPVGVRDVKLIYDYKIPLALYMIGGQATISFQDRRTGLKPKLMKIVVWSSRGFKMELTGAGAATALLGTGFNLVGKVSPVVIEQFLASLFLMAGRKLLPTINIPL